MVGLQLSILENDNGKKSAKQADFIICKWWTLKLSQSNDPGELFWSINNDATRNILNSLPAASASEVTT